MSSLPLLYIKDGALAFADKTVFEDVELYLYDGDRICFVGKNGSGKSSLLKVLSGDYYLSSGDRFVDSGITVGYLQQNAIISNDCTVHEYLMQALSSDEEKYLADIVIQQLQLDKLSNGGDTHISVLSGGEARRCLLARTILKKPKILMLDEPTNHLDIIAIEWLEGFVKSYNGVVICISHDRTFLSNVTNKIWWLDRGILRKSEQGFKYFEEWQNQVIEYEEAVLRKMNRKMEAENLWLQQGVTARRKRNQKRLANLIALREQLRSTKQHLHSAKQKAILDFELETKQSRFIIEAINISFAYDNKQLVKDYSLKVTKGEKIGIIGPNGSGKSTFLRLLMGELEPQSGKIRRSDLLDVTYFDQHRTDIDMERTLWQTMCPTGGDHVIFNKKEMHVAGYLKQFMFDPKTLNDKVSTLSGGQVARLLLARALTKTGNVLILDEPTNDLDTDTLDLLLEILADYDGTLFVVSHDRDFLEQLVTRTLIFTENSGNILDLVGGYSDYLKFYKTNNKVSDTKPIVKNKEITEIKNTTIRTDAKRKLSYKEQRMLELLPKEIEDLEKRIKEIEHILWKNTVDIDKISNLAQELEKTKALLEEKFEMYIMLCE